MNFKERIVAHPDIMLGKPVIKGTRITVELVLQKLSEGASHAEILTMYPHLVDDDILAVLQYASEIVAKEEFIESTK